MKLLILTQKVDANDPNLGFFHRWIEEFARQCESVIVICLYEGQHQLPKNVRILSLGKESGVSRMKYLRRFFGYIWQERKNYGAVFVHMNQVYALLGGLIWRVLNKKTSLWYAHGSVSSSLRWAEKCVDIIFTSTPEGFRLKSKKVHIVGQGIDLSLFAIPKKEKNQDIFKIISVGRIGPVKHLEVLIKALPLVMQTIPQAELHLYGSSQTAGEKDYLRELETLVTQEELGGKVHFDGPVVYSDLPEVLADADVFAQASQTGSLDKAVLEALAADVPAVSTNEAFVSFPGVVSVAQTPVAMANGIIEAQGRRGAPEYIAQHHSLHSLVRREIEALETFHQST